MNALLYLVGGMGLGALYFYGLRWNVRLFIGDAHRFVAIGLVLLRFAVLATLLVLIARQGALPLVMTSAGLLIGRFAFVGALRRKAGAGP